MNLELKNISYLASRSDETYCYSANLYVDGKPVAVVGNSGNGGCDDVEPHPKVDSETYRVVMDKVNDYLKGLPKDPEFNLPIDLEIWCGEEVTNFLKRRDAKKVLKRIVFLDSNGNLMSIKKLDPTPENLALVKGQKTWDKSNIILNELPFDKALEYL